MRWQKVTEMMINGSPVCSDDDFPARLSNSSQGLRRREPLHMHGRRLKKVGEHVGSSSLVWIGTGHRARTWDERMHATERSKGGFIALLLGRLAKKSQKIAPVPSGELETCLQEYNCSINLSAV
jgi:hypothetical protein